MNIKYFSNIKLNNLLFKGGSGNVYKININNKDYVVKKIKNNMYNDIEYTITSNNNNDNLVKCIYKKRKKDYTLLFFDYYKNGDLLEFLQNKNIGNKKFTHKYVYQMLNCIKSLNDIGYIHLDIKLENFLLDDNHNLVLCDFGSSKKIIKNDNILIGSKNIMGTKSYNSPEVNLRYYGNKSDVWNVGVCMYMMLTGTNLYRSISELYDKDYEINLDSISDNSLNFIDNLLQIQPSNRYSVVSALNDEIFEDQYIVVL